MKVVDGEHAVGPAHPARRRPGPAWRLVLGPPLSAPSDQVYVVRLVGVRVVLCWESGDWESAAQDARMGTSALAAARVSCWAITRAVSVLPGRVRHSW
jgi:hypothetical protein